MIIEMIHTRKASLPVVPAMPPMEKSTRGGTPAATQKAPFQSSARTSSPEFDCCDILVVSSVVPNSHPPEAPRLYRAGQKSNGRETRQRSKAAVPPQSLRK